MTSDTLSYPERLRLWERLRLTYNVILFVVGVPVAVSAYYNVHALSAAQRRGFVLSWSPMSVAAACLVFGFLANVFFMFGPLAEVYISAFTTFHFGRKHRIVLFSVGLIFSLLVQAAICLNFLLLPLFAD